MAHDFHLKRLDLALLLFNCFALGGCVVLLVLAGPSAPLILLTIGVIGMAGARIARGFSKGKDIADSPVRQEVCARCGLALTDNAGGSCPGCGEPQTPAG